MARSFGGMMDIIFNIVGWTAGGIGAYEVFLLATGMEPVLFKPDPINAYLKSLVQQVKDNLGSTDTAQQAASQQQVTQTPSVGGGTNPTEPIPSGAISPGNVVSTVPPPSTPDVIPTPVPTTIPPSSTTGTGGGVIMPPSPGNTIPGPVTEPTPVIPLPNPGGSTTTGTTPATGTTGGSSPSQLNPVPTLPPPSNIPPPPNQVPLNPDTTPPSVAFTSPVAGGNVIGGVTGGYTNNVQGTASDNVGIKEVKIWVGTTTPHIATLSPMSGGMVNWNSTWNFISLGNHTLHAVATDMAGNTKETQIIVTAVAAPTTPTSGPPPNQVPTTPTPAPACGTGQKLNSAGVCEPIVALDKSGYTRNAYINIAASGFKPRESLAISLIIEERTADTASGRADASGNWSGRLLAKALGSGYVKVTGATSKLTGRSGAITVSVRSAYAVSDRLLNYNVPALHRYTRPVRPSRTWYR